MQTENRAGQIKRCCFLGGGDDFFNTCEWLWFGEEVGRLILKGSSNDVSRIRPSRLVLISLNCASFEDFPQPKINKKIDVQDLDTVVCAESFCRTSKHSLNLAIIHQHSPNRNYKDLFLEDALILMNMRNCHNNRLQKLAFPIVRLCVLYKRLFCIQRPVHGLVHLT